MEKETKLFKKKNKYSKNKKVASIAVGDGQNDIEMIKFASLGVAWKGFQS